MTEPQTYYERFQMENFGNILEGTENSNEFEDERAIATGEALEYEILREENSNE